MSGSRLLAGVRTILFTLLFFGVSVPLTLLALAAWPLGAGAVGRIATLWGWCHRLLSRVVLGQRVVVEGELPPETRFIVAKHEAMFETIDALCLFRHPVIVAKQELLAIPFWGWVARRYGVIPVDRAGGSKALRAMRAAAGSAMARGQVFLFFPEGTRLHHGEAPPIKAGFAGLYNSFGLPVVPVAIDSGRLNPRGRWLRFPGTITWRIGAAIPPGLPRAEAEARVHAAINALNAQPAKARSIT